MHFHNNWPLAIPVLSGLARPSAECLPDHLRVIHPDLDQAPAGHTSHRLENGIDA